MKKQLFLDITKQYQGIVFNICNSIVMNHEDAYDLSQEVFLKAWLTESFCTKEFFHKAWLIKVSRNLSLNFKRDWKRSILKLFDFGSYQKSYTEFESTLEKKESLEFITKALSEMSLIDRQVLSLKYFADLSYTEISKELGIAEGTVMSRLSRSKKKLMLKLEGEFDER
ncbi:MAG: hypothetical protein COB02_17370 [Candidatus Cloacimonadota bacterium]|nr:MAG: hypothetical protein COB02_17370 [Candidatus Cloacimonadota bacterium]